MAQKIAFDIYQYEYGNKKTDSNFKDLTAYKEKYKLELKSNEMLISGRVCENIKCGDRLFFENGEGFVIQKISAYGHNFEAIEAGMTCAILGESTKHLISQFEKLYVESEETCG